MKEKGINRKELKYEKYNNFTELDSVTKKFIIDKTNSIFSSGWGSFPAEVLEHHLNGSSVLFLKYKGAYIGVGALSIKNLANTKVRYIEFLGIKKDFQNFKLGPRLSYYLLRSFAFRSIIYSIFNPIEIMFITPNLRVLYLMAKYASFIYPNPFHMTENGLEHADEQTWRMAQELIKQSDNPMRTLHREGLILENSYSQTPWLIYNQDNAPWHRDERLNQFAKKYLGYEITADKELIVRTKLNIFSLIRYLITTYASRSKKLWKLN